jgi:AP-2 complex subunit sigma-1
MSYVSKLHCLTRLSQFRNYKIVYRRYAGLFFCVCVDANDNELAYLEAIHFFVEVLGEWSGPIWRV